jgi:hypothetical protein
MVILMSPPRLLCYRNATPRHASVVAWDHYANHDDKNDVTTFFKGREIN